MLIPLISIFLSIHQTAASISCNDEEECAEQTIDTTEAVYCMGYDACEDSTITSTDKIYCFGYEGCGQDITLTSPLIKCLGHQGCIYTETIESSGEVECTGNNGCYSVGTITADTINCDGKSSCAHVGALTAETLITCDGVLSCYDTNIETTELECNGIMSCIQSNISVSSILALGPIALHASIIDTEGKNELNVTAVGYWSGYEASIYCRAGTAKCQIVCEGTGCQNLFIYFEGPPTQITMYPSGCRAPSNNGIQLGGGQYTTWCPYIEHSSAMTMEEFKEFKQETMRKNVVDGAEAMIGRVKGRYDGIMEDYEGNLNVEHGRYDGLVTRSRSFVAWSPDNVLIISSMLVVFMLFSCIYAYRRNKEYEAVI